MKRKKTGLSKAQTQEPSFQEYEKEFFVVQQSFLKERGIPALADQRTVAGVSLMLACWYKLTLLMFVRLQKPASPSLYFENFTHR